MLILSAVINGLLHGGLLALMAFGMNLMFGVVKVIHLAYGQVIMVGLYLIYVFVTIYGLSFIAACIVSSVLIAVLSILIYLVIVRPLLDAPHINQLLALAGLWVILENACLAIFGASYKAINIRLPVINIGDLYLSGGNLIGAVVGILILGILYFFLNKTFLGTAIKSISQDPEIASTLGVNPRVIYLITFAIGGILAGISAACFMPIYSVYPQFGGAFTLMAFIIVIVGGMGNLLGGSLAAFLIGVVTSVVSTLYDTEIGHIVALFLCLLIIIFRPQGLLEGSIKK